MLKLAVFNFLAGAENNAGIDGNSKWDVTNFFKNSQSYGKTAGGAFIALLGVILVLFGAYKIFRAITSPQGRGAGNWFAAVLALIFGGLFAVGGFKMLGEIAGGGQTTVTQLGGGTILEPAKAFITVASGGKIFF